MAPPDLSGRRFEDSARFFCVSPGAGSGGFRSGELASSRVSQSLRTDREALIGPRIRWTTGIAGLLITGIGLVATWKVLAPGFDEMGASLEGWMFEGPALVTFGLLLLWTSGAFGKGGIALEGRGPRLLMHIGVGFLALPILTWVWNAVSGTAASHYAWTSSAFALGVPGVALTLVGVALWLWRRVRREGT